MIQNAMAVKLDEAFAQAQALKEPLGVRLKMVADTVRALNPGFSGEVDQFIGRLRSVRAGDRAPAVGERMPPFVLPDETGRFVSLEEEIEQGPVALIFHRGHWCPYCRLNIGALAEIESEIHPVRFLAISAERQAYTRRLKAESGVGFPLLTDVECGYALSINLAILVDERMASLIAAAGWDVCEYQGSDAWVLPIPAVFVVGGDGRVIARHVDPNYRERMELRDIVAAARLAR